MPRTRSKSTAPATKKVADKKAAAPESKVSELEGTIAAVNKRYGKRSVVTARQIKQPHRISTGIFSLDFATLGGIPHNRCTGAIGEKHAGKTTLASLLCASAQLMYPDQQPVVVDVEGTFDSTWAEKLGVNPDQLLVSHCHSGEMAVDVTDALIGSKEVSLVIVDSIAALTPMKEIEDSAEDAHVGIQAKLVSNMVRRVTTSMIEQRKRDHYVTVLFINQFRAKIGGFARFGEPRSEPGGRALGYALSLGMTIKNKENKGKDNNGLDDVITDSIHPFTITKNKMNGGPRAGEFRMVREYEEDTGLSEGQIDNAETMLAFAKKFHLYHGGGSKWFLEFGEHKYQVRKADEALNILYSDTGIAWALRNHLLQMQATKLGMPRSFIESIK